MIHTYAHMYRLKITGAHVLTPALYPPVLHCLSCLQACDTPVSPAWISSTITRIASPQAVRAASPLELVRACLALQYLDERQQEQQQQEGQRQQERQQQQEQPQPNAGGLWRGELRVGLLQEMVRKLQAGQAKALAMGDVVDVLQ
eukprot:scaffold222120_cov17-Tisochrysis_lutea.AAC.1